MSHPGAESVTRGMVRRMVSHDRRAPVGFIVLGWREKFSTLAIGAVALVEQLDKSLGLSSSVGALFLWTSKT